MTAPAVTIVPYAGYRTETRLKLRARVLRHSRARAAPKTAWQKFRAMVRLYTSREVAGVDVALSIADQVLHATSDADGYAVFDVALPVLWPLPEHTHWDTGTLTAPGHVQPDGATEALVLAPGRDIHHAIVSDLDDTVLETGVWNLARNWRRVLASTPADRIVVPGVEDLFYNVGGGAGADRRVSGRISDPSRPFFYVSSSPWNLYGFLDEFLKLNQLPRGPMELKDWGFNLQTLGRSSHGAHKSRAIGELIEFFPDLKFILIGDDSQGDVGAYAAAVASHIGRVAGVFIRNVSDKSFSPEEQAAIAMIETAGVPVWAGSAFDAGDAMIAAMGLSTSAEIAQVAKTLERSEIEHDDPTA